MSCSLVVDAGTLLYTERSGFVEDAANMRQGFDIWIGAFKIHFADEQDAEKLAEAILTRQGKLPLKER